MSFDPLWDDVAVALRLGFNTDDLKGNPITVTHSPGDEAPAALNDGTPKWSPDYDFRSYIASTGGFLSFPSSALTAVNFGQGDFCFDVWIRPRTFTTVGGILFSSDSSVSDPGLLITHIANNQVQVQIKEAGGSQRTSTALDLGIDQWQLLVVERVGTSIFCYVNDSADYEFTSAGGNLDITTGKTCLIGGDGVMNGHRAYMNDFRLTANKRYDPGPPDFEINPLPSAPMLGAAPSPKTSSLEIPGPLGPIINEDPEGEPLPVGSPTLYARVPTRAEVTIPAPLYSPLPVVTTDPVVVDPYFDDVVTLQHFQGSFFQIVDRVPLTQTGPLTISQTNAKWNGYCVSTDGLSGFQEGEGFNWMSDWTVDVWVYLTSLTFPVTILDTRTASNDYEGFYVRIESDNALKMIYHKNGSAFLFGGGAVSLNTHTLISIERLNVGNNPILNLYIDGNLVAQATPGSVNMASTRGRFFHDYGLTTINAGMFADDLRVTERARYQSQNFTPPTEQFFDGAELNPYPQVLSAIPGPLGSGQMLFQASGIFIAVPGPLSPPRAITQNDFTGLLLDESIRFVMVIEGTPALEYPITSWQATLQTERLSYVQAVIPWYNVDTTELANRVGSEQFAIYRVGETVQGEVRALFARAPLESTQSSQGPRNASIVISGYSDQFLTEGVIGSVALEEPRSRSISSNGSQRVRASINWFLRPGQTVTIGEDSFVADFINYYCPSEGDLYMDVGSRGTG